eukprot:CAMPEP_0203765120 /NCGR_PEP_ID=MMETSP0098-20131031/18240_1 /ASSEMBLY_ACC=CAM_ASM_000208 /TAXON_ID=96639 /ORGANISM=" , Strain NY0313808BC1" /LENGTH=1550 /DNA_ID=CAMNT_0050661345 /DNA_START=375 /DNA_END=5027 /DNA_ORIENTATION=-
MLKSTQPSNEDVALVHLVLVLGLKEAVRRVIALALSRRERYISSTQTKMPISEDIELDDSMPEVRNLLDMLEVCLWHGLKDETASQETEKDSNQNPLLQLQKQYQNEASVNSVEERHFWPYVLTLESVNGPAFAPTIMLVRMNANCTTPRGLCRAWIRQLLNQNALEFTLRALCKAAPTAGTKYYEDWAFIRWNNEVNRTMFFNLLRDLNNIGFDLRVNASLDGLAPSVPGPVLTTKTLVMGISIESGLAASCSDYGKNGESTLLLVSNEDFEVSGRYVFLGDCIYGNKITGFQISRTPWNGLDGWGIFSPSDPESPMYYVATKSAKLSEPPIVGWRVAERKGVFKPPSMLRLKYPTGLRTPLLTGVTVSKDTLIRDEIQALRVEVKQIHGYKGRLDELRQIDVHELENTTELGTEKQTDGFVETNLTDTNTILGTDAHIGEKHDEGQVNQPANICHQANADVHQLDRENLEGTLSQADTKGASDAVLNVDIKPDQASSTGTDMDIHESDQASSRGRGTVGTNTGVYEQDQVNPTETSTSVYTRGQVNPTETSAAVYEQAQVNPTETSTAICEQDQVNPTETASLDHCHENAKGEASVGSQLDELAEKGRFVGSKSNEGANIDKKLHALGTSAEGDLDAIKMGSSLVGALSCDDAKGTTAQVVREPKCEIPAEVSTSKVGPKSRSKKSKPKRVKIASIDEDTSVLPFRRGNARRNKKEQQNLKKSKSIEKQTTVRAVGTTSTKSDVESTRSADEAILVSAKVDTTEQAGSSKDSDSSFEHEDACNPDPLISEVSHSVENEDKTVETSSSTVSEATTVEAPSRATNELRVGDKEETYDERMERYAREEEESLAEMIREDEEKKKREATGDQEETYDERMERYAREEEESLAEMVREDEEKKKREATGDQEETYDERMERYAREEEESLAEMVREDEEKKKREATEDKNEVAKEQDNACLQRELAQLEAHRLKLKERRKSLNERRSGSVQSIETNTASCELEEMREIVRAYSKLDPTSPDACVLSERIFDMFSYVVDPMSDGKDLTPKTKESFFRKHIRVWNRTKSDNSPGKLKNGREASSPPPTDRGGSLYVVNARVVSQHISRGADTHVRYVIRVALSKTAWCKPVVRGDASIIHNDVAAHRFSGSHKPKISRTITVQRRFRDFKQLHLDLQREDPETALPPLPKTAWTRSFTEEYISKKRAALDAYLEQVLRAQPVGAPLAENPVLFEFLTVGSNLDVEAPIKEPSRQPNEDGALRISLITDERPDPNKLQAKDSQGLAEQDFKCISCASNISIALGKPNNLFRTSRDRAKRSARFCSYTERWFCPSCFLLGLPNALEENEEVNSGLDEDEDEEIEEEYLRLLPTRILHHWDFSFYSVSFAAAEYLDSIFQHPLLCVSAVNPKLFSEEQELQHARLLRLQLTHAREAIEQCARCQSKSNIVTPTLGHRVHLAKDTELYSVSDLYEMQQGNLIPLMMTAVERLAEHITSYCELCKARGHICEICNAKDTIYPFQIITTVQCRKCKSYAHRECFSEIGGEDSCPTCLRQKR